MEKLVVIVGDQAFKLAVDALGNYDLAHKYSAYVRKKEYSKRTGRVAYKDSSMTKVYRAEFEFARDYIEEGGQFIEFADYDEARKYLNRVLKSKLWSQLTACKGHKKVDLIMKKDMGYSSRTAGMSWGSVIQLCPRTGLNQYVLLHELAHSAGNMHHDIRFRQDLIKLISRFVGRDAAKLLKRCFKEAGLKMSFKSTIKTPEEWYKSYIKMAKLRDRAKVNG